MNMGKRSVCEDGLYQSIEIPKATVCPAYARNHPDNATGLHVNKGAYGSEWPGIYENIRTGSRSSCQESSIFDISLVSQSHGYINEKFRDQFNSMDL